MVRGGSLTHMVASTLSRWADARTTFYCVRRYVYSKKREARVFFGWDLMRKGEKEGWSS